MSTVIQYGRECIFIGSWHRDRVTGEFTGGGGSHGVYLENIGDTEYPFTDPIVSFVNEMERNGFVVAGDLRPQQNHSDCEVAETGHSYWGHTQSHKPTLWSLHGAVHCDKGW